MYTYYPQGVCSMMMEIDLDGDTIKEVVVTGGCNGNLQGVSRLIQGMNVDEAISKLEGIRCGFKPTSCPDQMAKALRLAKEEQK